ncbi:MAG: rubrerythrin family protein [Desulfobacterales bacterium]|nr:MAG: rubrerythrin family protein [Desulfobacterales bacterium]
MCALVIRLSIIDSPAAAGKDRPNKDLKFPTTITVLKAAYLSEMRAHKHYAGYCQRSIADGYPNIAFLFAAFAFSEKVHADNYKRILLSLHAEPESPAIALSISDTKTNLIRAAENERVKITKTYPDFLAQLQAESNDQAVINCTYSWKSHQQHRDKIEDILKYAKLLFGSVAKRIEGMKLDFYVCKICGSTIDESPKISCVICNYPISYYQKVLRPA